MNRTSADSISNLSHVFFAFLIVSCIAFIVWAYMGRLDVVSATDGEVVPRGKQKKIQHLEGGIVKDILVREGEEVSKGQKLAVLESTRSKSELAELKVRIDSLRVDEIRLKAEAEGREELHFPEKMVSELPKLVRESRQLWRQKQERLESRNNELEQAVEQTERRIQEIRSRLESNRRELPMLKEQVDLSSGLLKDNLTTRYRHLELKRKLQNLKGSIQEDKSKLQRALSARREARAKMETFLHSQREKAAEKLKKTRQEIAEFSQRIRKFEDNLRRTIIRSPVRGIVHNLRVSTRGAVVKSGETIMDIVPSDDRLVIEAHLPISDIGYVHPDQEARIKLASADSRKFGDIKGKVVNISPDTVTTEKGRTFYPVRIRAERGYFQSKGQKYRLYPGMIVMVYIRTGTRSILDYILDPFMNTLSASLQER